jgi:membrane protease YdiL (CAAX protease family)
VLNRIPVIVRAVLVGILVGMIAANVWPILLLKIGMPIAVLVELVFLLLYVCWAAGRGPPARLKAVRADYFRARAISRAQWCWGVIAAVSFAVTVHAALVVLFRIVPFPAEAFHHGYDFSFIGSQSMQWLACIISALSAGVCEETGFRGYMQRPIEHRHGPVVAILISSCFFTAIHLTKDWALIGMVPIVFGAGIMLGTLARASGTLVFCILGHWLMDIGLFAFWWTQIAGNFSQLTIFEVGVDFWAFIECAALVIALSVTLIATRRLSQLTAA